ncbi:NAD(P)-dependent alcohol dehydrogenase [Photobacterium sp. 1_MG-2023]|uniref:zinc-dependent alcohol dehydrogenase family protein n=1 Tax=Photobacterium sp. 1_MG-2023 TaxID=3062646 RepID=UPI0026E2BAA5|nr:NAD(P)-dependent alcohol dehydrogenase [Photobacterium sp. 1_MG-2023]MDO6707317.1 NAD(P)-dependent alcohol dehydrogenase [Photobacterium sp. 1_MG-2023]
MKSYIIQEGNDAPNAWLCSEQAIPETGPGQIRVKMKAASVNYRDLLAAKGLYKGMVKENCIPASDGAGIVDQIGEGVHHLKPGDRVVAAFSQTWLNGPPQDQYRLTALGGPIDGVLTEYAVFDESGLVKLPDGMSFEAASTVPCAAVTAWHALMTPSVPLPGTSVLTIGSGGVSVFAIQFAKAAGLKVIALTGSEEKEALLYELGADVVINSKAYPEWPQEVLRQTQGKGVDQVVEVGGPGTLPLSVSAIRLGGKVSLIGLLAGVESQFNPLQIVQKNAVIQGITVGSVAMLEQVLNFMDVNQIKPVIDSQYSFKEAPSALEKLASGTQFGKVVIRINE